MKKKKLGCFWEFVAIVKTFYFVRVFLNKTGATQIRIVWHSFNSVFLTANLFCNFMSRFWTLIFQYLNYKLSEKELCKAAGKRKKVKYHKARSLLCNSLGCHAVVRLETLSNFEKSNLGNNPKAVVLHFLKYLLQLPLFLCILRSISAVLFFHCWKITFCFEVLRLSVLPLWRERRQTVMLVFAGNSVLSYKVITNNKKDRVAAPKNEAVGDEKHLFFFLLGLTRQVFPKQKTQWRVSFLNKLNLPNYKTYLCGH